MSIIYIGKKPVMNYVVACMTSLNQDQHAILKARGQTISRLVDAVEVLRNQFRKDVEITGIEIGTEVLDTEEGPRRVSTMEITLRS